MDTIEKHCYNAVFPFTYEASSYFCVRLYKVFKNCYVKCKTNNKNYIFREVLLGEYQVGKDPDCTTTNGRKTCAAPAIKRKPAKTIVHENYEESPPFFNDIALVSKF